LCAEHAWTRPDVYSESRTDCICNAGYKGPDGGPCQPCAAGEAKPNRGNSLCEECLEGKYPAAASASSSCLSCPLDSNAPRGSDAIVDCSCNVGYTGAQGANCTACLAGTYKELIGSSQCVYCIAGKYSSASAATSMATCVPCEPGKASANSGANSSDVCEACRPGKYETDSGSSRCTDCASGKYASDTGATSELKCMPCPAGTNSSQSGATNFSACQICPAGTWSQESSPACTPCPFKSWSTPRSESVESCLCEAGFFGEIVKGDDKCTACVGGKFLPPANNHDGRAGLLQAGYHDDGRSYSGAKQDTCETCGGGTSASAGSSSCTTCQAGTFAGSGSSSCTTCPLDTYSNISADKCSNCTTDYCPTKEYRLRCLPGSTADVQCQPCRTYRLCTSKPCFPVITSVEPDHTKFVGHGGYNDSCPEVCKPPFFWNCQTGSPSPAPQIAQANLQAQCQTMKVALKAPLCSLPPSFCS
jgi:hypothetical protein